MLKMNTVDAFEDAVRSFLCSGPEEIDHENIEVVAFSSPGFALRCALKSLGVSRGDFVCIPSFAPEEILQEILKLRAIPVFVGSEDDTWNMDHELLEDAVNAMVRTAFRKPKAVVMVSAYGMPPVVHRICEVCFRLHVPVIDYAADAMGSEFHGRKLGTFGQHGYGILSFEDGNVLSAGGGAALVCGGKEEKGRILDMISKRVRARMSEHCAEVALAGMDGLAERITRRKAAHANYESMLKAVGGIKVHSQSRTDAAEGEPQYFDSNYHMTAVLLDKGTDMDAVRVVLAEAGIETGRLYRPLHTYPEYADYPKYTDCICEELYSRGLYIKTPLQ